MFLKKGTNKFYIGHDESSTFAEVSYIEMGKINIMIRDTIISENSNQEIGHKLIEEIVEYARQEKKRIVPRCPYAKKIITDSQYVDILAP